MLSPVFVGSDEARDQMGLLFKYIVGSGDSVDEAFTRAYNKCVGAA